MWHDLLAALALLLVVEGIFPFLNPAAMRKTLLALSVVGDQQLRIAGITSMILGLLLLYWVN